MALASKIVQWIALVVALFGIVSTILPMFPTKIWWIRDMGFPRVQLSLLLAASCLLLFSVGRWSDFFLSVAILGTLCLGYQIIRIFPYTAVAPTQSLEAASDDPDRHVRLMVSNVLMTNRNAEGLFEIIRETDPDVFLAVETDRWWTSEISAELKEEYPYQVVQPLENTYGIILCSRYELIDPVVRYLVEDTIPSIHAKVKLPTGTPFDLHCVHPTPPIPGKDTHERDAELLIVARMVDRENQPAIVVGDLNDVAWSHTTHEFQEISGMLDPRRGRGTYSTFNANYFFLRYPLDHIFHTNHFRLVSMTRLPGYGSDHFPICAEFSFEPEGMNQQERPKASPEEHDDAVEEIENGLQHSRMMKELSGTQRI